MNLRERERGGRRWGGGERDREGEKSGREVEKKREGEGGGGIISMQYIAITNVYHLVLVIP